jgi:serine/threonine protein kinase
MTVDRIADYTIIRSLGAGNYGEFFLVEAPPRLGLGAKHLALKVLAGSTNEDAFRRATRELRVFASVSSPCLATLFDAGQDGSAFYYSMEYFPLGSLDAPAQPVSRRATLAAVARAARAAHALHEVGVVHRDIKPANIMLHRDGAKLSDLGLAQCLTPGLTMTGMGPVDSIEYMDPDVLRGERASRASDIWSLGATLHRVLSGVGIYGEVPIGDPLLALRRLLTTRPMIDSSLSGNEAALVGSCLARDPTERPPTAQVLAERIDLLATASD